MAAGRSYPFGFVNQHNSSINSASSTNFAYGLPSGPALPSASAIPPQPPPRPNRTQGSSLPSYRSSPFGSYGLYNNNSYGGNPYMPYHSNYGMNYGYSGFGTSNSVIDDYNSLYRQVEGSSRQAFQSVESIVQAFTSVSMMLDSTFQALYSSFRAVVGVADNLSRLRSQLYSILSALAIMRTLKYIIRKILEVFRLRPKGHAAAAWQEASVGLLPQQSIFPADSKGLSSWPILMFFGIIVGAPWLIWKLISANEQPRLKGWILASVDGKKIGLVPANYIKEPVRCTGRKNILVENTINPVPSRSFSCPTDSQENYGKTVSDKNMEDIFESCHSAPTVT
ncbi:peroxisomal membrane protein PEX13 isoform X2 [Octopus sinensis]|uniref:Peroxin-13 n=1 Tax=Octopus sinensis TaxID=2607531 RepID=A0A6P7T2X9_9MOLL|nr:peroxisomal membrane protein PEX13 isoform X2 [Octopus sinensis]